MIDWRALSASALASHTDRGRNKRRIAGRANIALARSLAQRARVSTPNTPLLSIVIVAYKSRHEITGCLASIPDRLADRQVDVVVVDNSPGEGTGEIVETQFPAVRYVAAPKNFGFGRANNLGYASTTGEFVLFLNPDTVVNEPALTHCIARLREDARIGLISPRLELANGEMDLACRRSIPTLWDGFCRASGLAAAFPNRALFSGYNLTHLPPDGSYEVGAINGAFMMAPRHVLEQIASGPHRTAVFDEAFFMYGDDLDLCIRVARNGWKIMYDGTVTITHLKGVSVAKDYDLMSRAIFDANRDVYLKHFNPQGSGRVRLKYKVVFGAWKWVALIRAKVRNRRVVRPV